MCHGADGRVLAGSCLHVGSMLGLHPLRYFVTFQSDQKNQPQMFVLKFDLIDEQKMLRNYKVEGN